MLIRKDIRESEPGIDLFLDVQITNVNTCEPLKGVYVDFWMANSTGVYSDIAFEKTVVCHPHMKAWHLYSKSSCRAKHIFVGSNLRTKMASFKVASLPNGCAKATDLEQY